MNGRAARLIYPDYESMYAEEIARVTLASRHTLHHLAGNEDEPEAFEINQRIARQALERIAVLRGQASDA